MAVSEFEVVAHPLSDLFTVLAGLQFTLGWLLVLCGLMLIGQVASLALIHSMRREVRSALDAMRIYSRKGTSK